MTIVLSYTITYIENEDVWRLHSPEGSYMADFSVYKGEVKMLDCAGTASEELLRIASQRIALASDALQTT